MDFPIKNGDFPIKNCAFPIRTPPNFDNFDQDSLCGLLAMAASSSSLLAHWSELQPCFAEGTELAPEGLMWTVAWRLATVSAPGPQNMAPFFGGKFNGGFHGKLWETMGNYKWWFCMGKFTYC